MFCENLRIFLKFIIILDTIEKIWIFIYFQNFCEKIKDFELIIRKIQIIKKNLKILKTLKSFNKI